MITLQAQETWAGPVKQGQRLGIAGRRAVHVVIFSAANVRERFDDARTRGNPGKLFITAGDYLLSKSNRKMMRITTDTYSEGTHDLATGTCMECRPALVRALQPWGVDAADVPGSFNIFKTVAIDGNTGALTETATQPTRDAQLELEAEMDCLVAVCACAAPATEASVVVIHPPTE